MKHQNLKKHTYNNLINYLIMILLHLDSQENLEIVEHFGISVARQLSLLVLIVISSIGKFYAIFLIIVIIAYPFYLEFISARGPGIVYRLGYVVYLFFICAYSYTSLRNPGIVMRKLAMFDELYIDKIKDDQTQYCKICNIVKKPNSNIEHCFDCNLCVEGIN